jgi:sugar phosphate isomerase/epimerase
MANRISLNVYSFNIALNNVIQRRWTAKPASATNIPPVFASLDGQMAGASQAIAPATISIIDLIEFCHAQDIYAIDATGYYWWQPGSVPGPGDAGIGPAGAGIGFPVVPPMQNVMAFVAECKAEGIAISGTGVQNNFASPYADQRQSDLQLVKRWCEVAQALGVPVLRIFAGPIPTGYGWDQVASWMTDCFWQCAEYGKQYGVKIGVQNHGDMLQTGAQCIRCLRMVDHPWFGLVNDTGYFLTPDPYVDIAQIMPYTLTFQVKESVRAVKNFQASVTQLEQQLVPIIRDSGYTGWLPVETLQAPDDYTYDPRINVPAFVGSLRCAMGADVTAYGDGGAAACSG